ncbi:gamma-glutamyl-gamma-aminobutyrate hydrolase family protein [Candidatus Deianiraea vastatrix]|uniref:Glutamine amidotransferase n=1 Tax=Candidatus Deianiraea vastatrix TaxID=2163644 RepID=A0A5B8XDV4_9RICK|nr:gamma-glutamyl-gamma-aminobutyrate hydrolase family protein [Candidatus Deianiraea vastatrix]QED23186.1 Putative glutamine amidotransferase [Candidatus Deianiraea vastatrix]
MSGKIIGITTNIGIESDDKFFKLNSAWVENFLDIFKKYDISVVFLPQIDQFYEKYIDFLDGLIISGNNKHVNPKFYGQSRNENIKESDICTCRTDFEMKMAKKFIEIDKPLFGICGGLQVINTVCGGTLVQHIPTQKKSKINHAQCERKRSWVHEVDVVAGTKLAQIVSNSKILTNTSHTQAIEKVGHGMVVNAISEDGIVEGAEVLGKKFCLGTQWHPEFNVTKADYEIFEAFARAVRF